MKIHVNRIPAEGLQEHATYDPAPLDMERDDIHLREPFAVDAFITKTDAELIVKADIRCPLLMTCARCLEDFSSNIDTDAIFHYKVSSADVVDITDEVRQEIVLAYPMFPICQPDCKGLCTTCGQNLNVARCSHDTAEHESA
ncbi:MAG: DUF177 domain-containing protein [Candidatus Omnitrophica bacterium]|nr:DUF177 domain-containing protein [Candidatus Omnitrophota bacterium]